MLDTETISGFSGGVYLQWRVFGHVVLTVTRLAGPNSVVSGLFLDPPSVSRSEAATTTATIVKQDSTTEGNWIGVYGSNGSAVAGSSTTSSLPSSTFAKFYGVSTFTWEASTTDARALEIPGGSRRVAAAWYNNADVLAVDFADGQPHDLALYSVDWTNIGRVEEIQVFSRTTGAVLDTETIANFANGVYLQWVITGSVLIVVTPLVGPNAVVSGIFFDPATSLGSSSAATASFVHDDTTIEGNWIGHYGTSGYTVVGDATRFPTFATIKPAGASILTWATSTAAMQALQNVGATGRMAAAWSSSTSFTLNVNVHGATARDVTVYALDWDNENRSEQIQISNAITGAVLDTKVISNFSTGVYLQWLVTGNVVIKVTRLTGSSAVLSGVFFDTPVAASAITASTVNPLNTASGSVDTSVPMKATAMIIASSRGAMVGDGLRAQPNAAPPFGTKPRQRSFPAFGPGHVTPTRQLVRRSIGNLGSALLKPPGAKGSRVGRLST
jgi:hypothetical protein